jgi:hypothetical protein
VTPQQLEARLREGVSLALDTNVLYGFRQLGKLDTLVRRANRTVAPQQIRLIVPALVHAEMLHDLRCHITQKGAAYDAGEVARSLGDKTVTIAAFEAEDGEGVSAQIFLHHPDPEDWRDAKRRNALKHLGLSSMADQISRKRVPATVDWFIAGHARGRNWLLVTHDNGPEFKGLERVGLEPLKAALTRMGADAAT